MEFGAEERGGEGLEFESKGTRSHLLHYNGSGLMEPGKLLSR